ncbi:hypothetical protein BH11PSE8_BH11PSE8_47020 [soil metagenome]
MSAVIRITRKGGSGRLWQCIPPSRLPVVLVETATTVPTDSSTFQGQDMNKFQILSRRRKLASSLVAATASVAVLSAVFYAFDEDGRTPWFAADSPYAAVAAACANGLASSARHRCLQQVARAAELTGSAPRLASAADRPVAIRRDSP